LKQDFTLLRFIEGEKLVKRTLENEFVVIQKGGSPLVFA
jgi:hypothetical protein